MMEYQEVYFSINGITMDEAICLQCGGIVKLEERPEGQKVTCKVCGISKDIPPAPFSLPKWYGGNFLWVLPWDYSPTCAYQLTISYPIGYLKPSPNERWPKDWRRSKTGELVIDCPSIQYLAEQIKLFKQKWVEWKANRIEEVLQEAQAAFDKGEPYKLSRANWSEAAKLIAASNFLSQNGWLEVYYWRTGGGGHEQSYWVPATDAGMKVAFKHLRASWDAEKRLLIVPKGAKGNWVGQGGKIINSIAKVLGVSRITVQES